MGPVAPPALSLWVNPESQGDQKMSKKDITVGPTEAGRWSVKRRGNDRASSIHDTQSEAINVGKRYAKEEKSDLIIKGKDGEIRSKDSYGNDPNPPKDKEH